jgi:hypothetical protein
MLSKLTDQSSYTLLSFGMTLFSIGIIVLPVFVELKISTRQSIHTLERFVLIFFMIEIFMRQIGWKKRYSTVMLSIDILVILPLFIDLFSLSINSSVRPYYDFPGLFLIKGIRMLRLLYFFQFFYAYREMGLATGKLSSPLKTKLFPPISAFIFFLLLLAGILIAILHGRLVESQKTVRQEQVTNHAKTFGITSTQNIFPNFILRIIQKGADRDIDIMLKDPELVKEYYHYGTDFIQLDGVVPGGSVQISFLDLNRRQVLLEFLLLISGVIVIASLILSLNFFLDRHIIEPVIRAMRVMDLRIGGEEIANTDIRERPKTEITALIRMIDLFYQKMRAQRKSEPK